MYWVVEVEVLDLLFEVGSSFLLLGSEQVDLVLLVLGEVYVELFLGVVKLPDGFDLEPDLAVLVGGEVLEVGEVLVLVVLVDGLLVEAA